MESLSRKESGSINIVPAAPGWFAIAPILECDGSPIYELARYPVIAWKIETLTARDGSTFQTTDAITIELTSDHECLQSPSGHFYIIQGDDFGTEQEAIAYFNRREEQYRKAREEARSIDPGAAGAVR